jgi:hypothetical protein
MDAREARKLKALITFARESTPTLDGIKWPTSSARFNRLSIDLRHMVSHIVMSCCLFAATLEDWRWDEGDAVFDFDVALTFRMGPKIDSRPLWIKTRLSFDPRARWEDECERLIHEVEALSEGLTIMQRAYIKETSACDSAT